MKSTIMLAPGGNETRDPMTQKAGSMSTGPIYRPTAEP